MISVKTEYNGKKFVLNPLRVKEAFEHFKGQEIELTVRKWKNDRTSRQNRAFHGWCKIIADETGDTPEDVKGEIKRKYLEKLIRDENGEPKIDPETGEFRTKIQDTSSLSIEEFSELQSRVMDLAEFLSIKLPVYED